ncbi:magnesium-transporting ATPase, P-type 1-like isoform X2 [Hibiscus syriacus]|uniref:Magnesium-transporting ATPase, P-type 1-like isoform X2 n=1 Tax=Hibiscus syriacus TaxID=106335 RepID=A0A6A2XIM2_HIBSY|nr:magnesium-transporting ATPase, P-type 1-like isoform X2 [Hibiscus syriacus]
MGSFKFFRFFSFRTQFDFLPCSNPVHDNLVNGGNSNTNHHHRDGSLSSLIFGFLLRFKSKGFQKTFCHCDFVRDITVSPLSDLPATLAIAPATAVTPSATAAITEYGSSKAAMQLSEYVRCPVRVQRCARRLVQTELIVQVDQRDVVPGDIVIFEPGDISLVIQSSLTGESWPTEKTADVREDGSNPLLELKNICFMGTNVVSGTGTGLVVSTGSKTYISTVFSTIENTNGQIVSRRYSFRDLGRVCPYSSNASPHHKHKSCKGWACYGKEEMYSQKLIRHSRLVYCFGRDILCIDKTGMLIMNCAIMVNHPDSWGAPGEKVLHFAFLNSYFKTEILNVVEQLSNEGLRIIGVAMKNPQRTEASEQNMENEDVVESDMVFLGVLTFFDPPKDSAKQALWQLAEKGVKAKVLTGDSQSLAIKICQEVGIRTTHVKTGPELEQLNQDAFHERVKNTTVLAQLTPSQKRRVVQSLQTAGDHVVGFLGDGINDSLSLDAANVGISVDSVASVAKDLADIILLEKDLCSSLESSKVRAIDTEATPRAELLVQRWSDSDPMGQNGRRLCKNPTEMVYQSNSSRLSPRFFRSAYFGKGLLMQTLIYYLLRTEKMSLLMEIASWPVIASTVVVSAIGIAISFSIIGDFMRFTELPLSYFGFLVVLFVGYFTVGQVVTRIYIMVYQQWL